MFFLHDAVYFMKSSSSCCSKTAPQHDATTSVLHSWYGVLRSTSFPLFPPNVTVVIMAKQLHFSFIRPQDMSPEVKVFVLVSFLQTVIWLFYVSLGVMASFSLSSLSAHVGAGLVSLWIMTLSYSFSSIFTRSLAFVLGLISTFRTKTRSSLGHRARLLPERCDGWTFP